MSGHRSYSHRLRRGVLMLLALGLPWVPALPWRLTLLPTAWSDGRLRLLQPTPHISISPPSVSFGSQDIGHIQGQLLTLTNTGSTPLTITRLAITGTTPADFRLDTDTCSQVSLPPAHSCVVNILFAPTAGGLRSASLAITDTAPTSPQLVALSGTGQPGMAVSAVASTASPPPAATVAALAPVPRTVTPVVPLLATATATTLPTTPPTPSPAATPSATAETRSTSPGRPTPTPSVPPTPPTGLRTHLYFAEGYTGPGYQEDLVLLNPAGQVRRVWVQVATDTGRTVQRLLLALAPLARRTVDVGALAPGQSTTLQLATDGPLVAERVMRHGNGHVVAGAQLSRHWYVAEGYVGAGFSDGLRLYNPTPTRAVVTVVAAGTAGVTRVTQWVVLAGTRRALPFTAVAPAGGVAVDLRSTAPLVVERVVHLAHGSGPSAALAVAVPARTWYFPDGGTDSTNQEYIAVLNPQAQAARVRVWLVGAAGYARPVGLVVRPHARGVLAVQRLVHQAGLAAVVEATQPVVAQEVRYKGGLIAVVDGVVRPARVWGLAAGRVGLGGKEWITLLNPTARAATVRVQLLPQHGEGRSVTVRVAAHHRAYLSVPALGTAGPVAALVRADQPIVGGRTLIFAQDQGLSTTAGVAGDQG